MNGKSEFLAYDESRNFADKEFHAGYCAPIVSLYFNAVCDVAACCKNQAFVLGNVGESSLDEIWHGAPAQDLGMRRTRAGRLEE